MIQEEKMGVYAMGCWKLVGSVPRELVRVDEAISMFEPTRWLVFIGLGVDIFIINCRNRVMESRHSNTITTK